MRLAKLATVIPSLERLDAIVIGSGQGGKPLAQAFARAGRRTAIIERDPRIGGTCVLDGCTPTKTLIASARVAHLARRAGEYGVRAAPVSVDMRRVRARKRALVEQFSGGAARGLEEQDKLELVHGDARFSAPHEVEVRTAAGALRRLRARTIVIDTGLRPAVPPIEGLADIAPLDNRSVMELDELPAHLAIVGGGAVGVEFAQMFRRLGSEVTLVQRASHLLEDEDEDISEALAHVLAEEGVRILPGSEAARVSRRAAGIALELRPDRSDGPIEATHLMLAAGRVPNTDGLNLEAAGVDTDARGFVLTDEHLETSAPGVYAVGDVKGRPAYTHVSYDDYRILRENLIEDGAASTVERLVPHVVYSDPELGRVGLSEKQARAAGVPYRVAKLPMRSVARALETGETGGLMKALVAAHGDEILGCAVLGVHGGEIMSLIQVAMMGTLPYTALRDGVFAHPTLAEALNSLFATLD